MAIAEYRPANRLNMLSVILSFSLLFSAFATPPTTTERAFISAEIDGLDDYKATNVNGNYMSFSNSLTLKGSTRQYGEDDGRSLTLKVMSFKGQPATFASPDEVISIEFQGLNSEHDGSRFKLNRDVDAPGKIVVESYADKRISGRFEGHLINREGQTLHVTNGQFQNVKVMQM